MDKFYQHAIDCSNQGLKGGDPKTFNKLVCQLTSASTEYQLVVAQTVAFSLPQPPSIQNWIILLELSCASEFKSVRQNAVHLLARSKCLPFPLTPVVQERIENCEKKLRLDLDDGVRANLKALDK
jgi:hypothetical protein